MRRKSDLDAVFATRPLGANTSGSSNRPPPATDGTDPTPLGAPNTPGLDRATPATAVPRLRSGAVAAMGGALANLAARAQLADQVESGATIVELDPAVIDPSFVSDRLADPTDPGQAALVASLAESGQQVPILVRPHPERAGRYQIAYGHRRHRAALTLRRPVRAMVRALTDAELVVAQGKENLERRDLSYIERALFARALDAAGFSRETIGVAMAADKADVSRYLALARSLPNPLVRAIGPAPKAGRARWQALVGRIADHEPKALAALLSDPAFLARSSDARFAAVLAHLGGAPTADLASSPEAWTDEAGRPLGRIERTARHVRLSIDAAAEPGLADYLVAQLPSLLAGFRTRRD